MPSSKKSWHAPVLLGLIVLGFILASIITLELIIEKGGPLRFPFHNELYPYVEFRPPSNATWKSEYPSPSSHIRELAVEYTNKDSFRIPSPDYNLQKQKPEEELRIAVIGGSTVRVGTNFEVTLPGSLKRILNAKYPQKRIEVINGGIISAISRQELIFLLTTVVDYEPDILIIYDGINDSGQMVYYEKRLNFPYNFRVMETAWDQYVTHRKDSVWRLLLDRSAILKWLWPQEFGDGRILNTLPATQLIENQNSQRKFAEAYIDNWEKINRICQAYGIRPLFVLQPTSLFSIFQETEKEVSPSSDLDKNLFANFLVYKEFRKVVKGFRQRHPQLTILDLSSLLPREAFYDGAHVYDEVNHTIAKNLADAMMREIPGNKTVLFPR